jgi:hypothetical protein
MMRTVLSSTRPFADLGYSTCAYYYFIHVLIHPVMGRWKLDVDEGRRDTARLQRARNDCRPHISDISVPRLKNACQPRASTSQARSVVEEHGRARQRLRQHLIELTDLSEGAGAGSGAEYRAPVA